MARDYAHLFEARTEKKFPPVLWQIRYSDGGHGFANYAIEKRKTDGTNSGEFEYYETESYVHPPAVKDILKHIRRKAYGKALGVLNKHKPKKMEGRERDLFSTQFRTWMRLFHGRTV